MFSKRLNAQAEAAIAKSLKMDGQEDPQKEIDRQEKKDRRPLGDAAEEPEDLSIVVLSQSHNHECPRWGVKWECGEANYQYECPHPTRTFYAKCWAHEVPIEIAPAA
jgi:hypothetical protein